MAILKGAFTYTGDSDLAPFKNIELQFKFPKFKYEQDDKLFRQVKLKPTNSAISLSLSNDSYNTPYSGHFIAGENLDLFVSWFSMIWNFPRSMDDLKLEIPYSIVGPQRILLGEGSIAAFFFFEDLFLAGSKIPDEFELTLDSLASTLFLVNAKEFYILLAKLELNTAAYLLEIIKAVGKFSENRAEQHNLTDEEIRQIINTSEYRDENITSETVERVIDHFEKLTSFPIEIEGLSEVKVAGNFNINTTDSSFPRSELAYYHLSVETTIRSVIGDTQFQMLGVDWGDDKTTPIDTPIDFKLAKNQQPLIVSSVEDSIIVRVAGFDGTTLWRQSYEPDSADLEHIEIVIDSHLPGKLETSELETLSTTARLLGQVLTTNKNLPISGLTVVLQAKEAEASVWRVVSAGETHGSGFFSLKYPKGKFVAAQAIVSVSPNSAVDIDIVKSEIDNETLSDDFLYLMLDLDEMPADTSSKCEKTSRLPDNTDLIASGEYTQDLGQCVNVTTPNRSLREYNYNAIVRISDPDVANYTLERIPDPNNEGQFNYRLSGGDQVIERTPVNLSNPIRWQDAPEASDDLSFYQSVTVATGHILFFKSIFKADGYSKGDCVYSLPLAPGQKKQIVSYDVANTLEASESQQRSQGENLSAGLFDDRAITNELSGSVNENLRGQSSASTAGVSAGLGLAGSISGTLGIAGGYANSNSSASQSGSRSITQHFGEKLRQSLIQNSESYRELNASVVTTVKEGQEYAVTTEVVSNHNHCHSITLMYFEVLRHYAISQELSDVQECLFVPMLLTEFTRENISKWKDILATNLLPIPSNTYLQPAWMFHHIKQHPLIRAFDANERQKTDYVRVDFPDGTYANDDITSIAGEFQLRINLPRPRTSFDRILSLPVVTKTVEEGSVSVKGAVIGAAIGSMLGGPAGAIIGGVIGGSSTTEKEILAKEAIFNAFFILDANYESVPPAKAIRINEITEEKPVKIDGETKFIPFFANEEDKKQWTTYTNILNERANVNYSNVYEMLNSLFSGRLISEWDAIFYKDIAPYIVEQLTESIKFSSNDASISLDLTRIDRYTKGDRRIRVRVAGDSASARNEIKEIIINSESGNIKELKSFAKVNIGNVRLNYTTEHFDGYIINRYIGNDLLDGVKFLTPLTIREKRNPKKEDGYLVEELLQHLNSNLEHYNKVLWRNLDPDRRYMLLDGFNIQIYDRSGGPLGYRSLASVIKNDLITITGNALVFPVADGFNVSQSLIIEKSEHTVEGSQPSLLDRYRPTRDVEPYRLSVPTRGVYMESVMGKCDACEEVKENSSQDWDKFRTEEPTAISPVTTPTPSRTDWHAVWAQFAQPLVELQTAGDIPTPGAGLSGLSDALAKSDAFRDITGLEGNQANVIKTYLSNQENAKSFAEMAKTMAMQQHNTENSKSIQQSIDDAKKDGTINDQEHSELTKDHLSQLIDGGTKQKAKVKKDPSLTNAAVDAVKQGKAVTASRNDKDGTSETLKVSESDVEETLASIFYDVPLIPQPNKTSCWAAAMAMLESYRQSKEEQMSIIYSATELANDFGYSLEQSYTWERLDDVKQDLGLEAITLSGKIHPTPKQWYAWLNQYGPLYVTIIGSPTHAIIVNGISGDTSLSGAMVNILNSENTRITFDADETVYTPPNDGLKWTLSVEELNQAFNGGELSELKFYENWRILYHPDLAPESTSLPSTTGSSGTTIVSIEAVNRFLETDKKLIKYEASITNATNSYDFTSNRSGKCRITGSIPNGQYSLIITPNHQAPIPTDWTNFPPLPTVGSVKARVWLEEIVSITIIDGQVTKVEGNNNFTLNSHNINVKLRPLWVVATNQTSRPTGISPEYIIIHGTDGTNDLPPHFVKIPTSGPNRGVKAGVHYVIPKNGEIIKMGDEAQKAIAGAGQSRWHSLISLNRVGIGIEIVNNGEDYTEAQYLSLEELLPQLRNKFGIPAHNILGHGEVRVTKAGTPKVLGDREDDPGKQFNWPRFETLTIAGLSGGVGIHPSSEADTFTTDSTLVYGEFYKDNINRRVSSVAGNHPTDTVKSIKEDLVKIGYHIHSSGNGVFDRAIQNAIRVFKRRFFSGQDGQPESRLRADNTYFEHVDFKTAKMIKRVLHAVENP